MKTILTRSLWALFLPLAAANVCADEVYMWKTLNGHTAYGDAPPQLQPARTRTLNVRSHTVYRSAPKAFELNETASLSEQQNALNDKISQANKQIEDQNKKIEEANRQNQQDNCKMARLNRQFAESARAHNRSALLQRYDSDVNKYCI